METACRCALASLWRRHVQGWPGGRVQSRIRKDGLAAGWRRTCNEFRMPVPNHGLRLNGGGCGLDLDQYAHRGHNRDGRRRVHCNAQRAMVGIAVQRMHVRHLHHGKQRQQDQAHQDGQRQSAWLCAAFPAEICLKSCQQITPESRIHMIGCAGRGRGYRNSPVFVRAGRQTRSSSVRLNCGAMAHFLPMRLLLTDSLAILLLAGFAAAAQTQTPVPVKPGVPGTGANHRLILKDGTYQNVRQYQIVGDRVRYISVERGGEWEELPAALVDWNATRKWERDHAAETVEAPSPAMKEAAEIDKEEAAERDEQKARTHEVAKGLELPDEDGVFALDTFEGTPELVELLPTEMTANAKTKHGLRD